MLRVGWRVTAAVLVFMGVFCYPFSLAELPAEPGPVVDNKAASGPASFLAAAPGGEPAAGLDFPAVGPGQPTGIPPSTEDVPVVDVTPAGSEDLPPAAGQALAAEAVPADPKPLQVVYRAEVDDRVGLSFDDGPHPRLTERYLEVLDQYHVQATFFMVGERVHLFPEAARLVAEQGSEIGSHSWRHARLDELDLEAVAGDLASVAQQVYAITGQEVTLFRPPYGRYAEPVLAAAQSLHQQVVLWNADPRDWENPPASEIVQRIMAQVRPGSIIILHEGHKNTLEALPGIIEGLRSRGLEPVPVSTLLQPPREMPVGNHLTSTGVPTGKAA